MTTAAICRAALLAPFVLLAACRVESDPVAVKVQAMSFANSSSNEQNATLARDGLSLYFSSNRPGGSGPLDIWVAQRACTDPDDLACAWQAPANLGSPINSAGTDFAPNLSRDGHLLFFSSNGGVGANIDIYVSRRSDVNDDFDWSAPVPLG